MTSMADLLDNSADVIVAASEKYNVSVPAPPANVSADVKPASVVLNVSAPVLPVILISTPAFIVTLPAAFNVTAPDPPIVTAPVTPVRSNAVMVFVLLANSIAEPTNVSFSTTELPVPLN